MHANTPVFVSVKEEELENSSGYQTAKLHRRWAGSPTLGSFARIDFLGPLRTRSVSVYIWKHHDWRMSDYNYTELLALTAVRMLKAQEKCYCPEHSLMCCPCLFKKKVRLFLERLVCKGDGDKCHIYVIYATVPWHFRQEETIILVRGLCWLREKGWWQGSNLKLAESNAHELNPDTVWPQAVY